MSGNYYLIGVYGYKKCTPISLEGMTLQAVVQARNWQEPQLAEGEGYHICIPMKKRGVFESIKTGALFETSRMGWTEEAYNAFLDTVWGAV